MAVSGGRTPWQMLRALGEADVPWEHLHVVQVDERVVTCGHAERNLTHILESLEGVPIPRPQIYAMPVEMGDLNAAAAAYARTLATIASVPPVLDLAHLGLGADGHTASLVPGDPVLNVTNQDVAPTSVYQGRPRLTLTYPLLNRARRLLWLVTGAEKGVMLKRLLSGDRSIPAGRITQDRAVVLADRAAAAGLPT